MAVPVTWETLRELAAFRSKQACALSLYLDIFNLFIFILRLMLALGGRRR